MTHFPGVQADTATGSMARGTVLGRAGERVLVQCDEVGWERIECELLYTSEAPALALGTGDSVLVWLSNGMSPTGVILGRIGPWSAPTPAPVHERELDVPDELVIEAKESLTLRVGDGSITLRADGKILIKGKDLVSHAQRMNRIKGGAVSIN